MIGLAMVFGLLAVQPCEAQRPKPEVVATIGGDDVYRVLPLGAIPAIDDPSFVSGAAANAQMRPEEPVLVDLGGAEIVVAQGADGGVHAFVAQIEGKDIELVFDPESGGARDQGGSVWNLSDGRCIAGSRKGERLEVVAVTPVYWFAWSSFYPNTRVVD